MNKKKPKDISKENLRGDPGISEELLKDLVERYCRFDTKTNSMDQLVLQKGHREVVKYLLDVYETKTGLRYQQEHVFRQTTEAAHSGNRTSYTAAPSKPE